MNIIYLNETDTPYELDLRVVKESKVELSLIADSPVDMNLIDTGPAEMAFENATYKYMFQYINFIGNLRFTCKSGSSLALTLNDINMTTTPGIISVDQCVDLQFAVNGGTFDGAYMEFNAEASTSTFQGINMMNTINSNEVQSMAVSQTGVFFNLNHNDGSHSISVENSTFTRLGIPVTPATRGRPVAAFALDTYDSVSEVKMFITNSTFTDNQRALDIAMKGQNSIQVSGCTFIDNTGDGAGGAIRISSHMDPGVGESTNVRNPDIYIWDSYFESNFAQNSESYKGDDTYYKVWAPGSGGAIYVYVTPRSPLKADGYVEIQGCTFTNNTANSTGGTIFICPVILTSIKNTTIENAKTTDVPRPRMGDAIFASGNMQIENIEVMINTAEESNPIIYYQAADLLNDKLTVSTLTMTCAKGFSIDQTITAFANGLQSLQLYCTPCSTSQYSLDITSITLDNALTTGDPAVGGCYDCPYGADCGNGIVNIDSFWGDMNDNGSEVNMYLCPDDYCTQDDSAHVQYNHCEENRNGTLCGSCVAGYSEALYGTACVPDEECGITEPASIGLLCLYLARGIIFVALLLFADEWESIVNSGIAKATPQGKADDVQAVADQGFLVIYFYFVQTVELFQVDIIIEKDETRSILRPEDVLPEIFLEGVNVGDEIQAASCFIPGIKPVEKLALTFVYPAYVFILLLLVYLCTGLCCMCRKKADRPRIIQTGPARLVLVLLALFLFMYQGIAESLLQLIQCVNVEGKSVLFIDGNIECLQSWQFGVIAVTCIFIFPFFLILLFGPKVLKERKMSLAFFFFALVFPIFCFIPIIMVFWGFLDEIPPFSFSKNKGRYSVRDIEQRMEPENEKYTKFELKKHKEKKKKHDLLDDSLSEMGDLGDSLRETVADSLVGTYRAWEDDGDDFLGGVCWEGVLNLQRLVLVVAYTFTPDVVLRQILLCFLIFIVLLLQMKLMPFNGKTSNRAQSGAICIILIIGMFNLIRATFFHSGVSPKDTVYVLVIFLEWIEIVCTKFLPWFLILVALIAVCTKGVKDKVDETRPDQDLALQAFSAEIGFDNEAYDGGDGFMTNLRSNITREPSSSDTVSSSDVGGDTESIETNEPFDPDGFTAKSPGPLPVPWRQKKYLIAREGSNASESETQFGRAPGLRPDKATATNWTDTGIQ